MPAQRIAAKATPKPPARTRPSAKRAEACRLLQLAPTADEELITQAYWHLARRHWANARHDPEARRLLDEVNQAYLTLNPSHTQAPLAVDMTPPPTDQPLMDEFVTWVRHFIEHTKVRWIDRVPEIVVLCITTAILALLALNSGGSTLWILAVAAAALVTIWAPWRRPR